MKPLFNSKGEYVANFLNGQLHSTDGKNIGHFIENGKIFIDMVGRYMGGIIYDNRLTYNSVSPYNSMTYGNYGDYGGISFPSGYEDVILTN